MCLASFFELVVSAGKCHSNGTKPNTGVMTVPASTNTAVAQSSLTAATT